MKTGSHSDSQIGPWWFTGMATTCLSLILAACSSTPPPAPVPPARLQAENMASAASKLSSIENWSAAARQWSQTADRFAALNDLVSQAASLHNLAQALRELYHTQSAQSNLLMAASLNLETGQTNAWWRNQITLIQLAQEDLNTVVSTNLERQFSQLSGRIDMLSDSEIKGLFYNEQGRWFLRQNNFVQASNALLHAGQAFASIQNQSGLAAVSENNARLLSTQTNWTISYQGWSKALTIYESLGDMIGIARCLEGQGALFLKQGKDLNAAEKLLKRASSNLTLLHKPFLECRALEQLVECLKKLGKPCSSEQSALASAHDSCAALMESDGNFSRAREHWLASQHLWQSLNQFDAAKKAELGIQRCSPANE